MVVFSPALYYTDLQTHICRIRVDVAVLCCELLALHIAKNSFRKSALLHTLRFLQRTMRYNVHLKITRKCA